MRYGTTSRRARASAALVAIGLSGCAGTEAPDATGSWVGTITTEGDVTTVVNRSGSR